jgi:hypothetical protein
VLWYCHKRGREVRLENERLVTEEEIAKLNELRVRVCGSTTTQRGGLGNPIVSKYSYTCWEDASLRLVTEEEIAKLNEDTSEGLIRPTETLTTTAPPGPDSQQIFIHLLGGCFTY